MNNLDPEVAEHPDEPLTAPCSWNNPSKENTYERCPSGRCSTGHDSHRSLQLLAMKHLVRSDWQTGSHCDEIN